MTASAPPGPQAVGEDEAPALADRPVTHLGRAVLARADTVVRGALETADTGVLGAAIGRVATREWLRGVPGEPGATIVVLAADRGGLPPTGEECVLFLAARPGSSSYGLVEWSSLAPPDGAPRLDALRSYLRIESIDAPRERAAALAAYLRGAAVAQDAWTRSNAAREYAAFASEFEGVLEEPDRAAIESALARTAEKPLRALLESALAACPGSAPPRAAPRGAGGAAAALAAFESRYAAQGASLAERRRCVIDAALSLGRASEPLLARALDDPDAPVRDAALAAAANFEVGSLAARVRKLLAEDPSPVVRRSAVIAAGRLRCEDCVPALGLLARSQGALANDAAFALARIRSPAAVAELRRARDASPDPERKSTIEFLLSDAFLEQERALANPSR